MKRLLATAAAVILAMSCIDWKGGCLQADAAEKTQIYGGDTEVYAGEVAEFTVSVSDNMGFCNCGIILHYDEALVPLYSEDTHGQAIPDCQLGALAEDRYTAAAVNLETQTLAFGVSGVQDYTDDGMLFRVYFKVPDDAKIGSIYDIEVVMDLLSDSEQDSKLSQVITANGSITVTGTVRDVLDGDKIALRCDTEYALAGSETEYTIDILENIGFGGCGMKLYYDERLTPVLDAAGKPSLEGGTALGGLEFSSYWEKDAAMMGISISGTQTEVCDGELLKLRFKMPEDAQTGDEFPIRIELDYFETDGHLSLIEYTEITNGWLAVPKSTAPRDPVSSMGDVNVDELVDISDVILLSRYISEDTSVSVSTEGKKNADMNEDNRYTAEDVVYILRVIAKLIEVKAAE